MCGGVGWGWGRAEGLFYCFYRLFKITYKIIFLADPVTTMLGL